MAREDKTLAELRAIGVKAATFAEDGRVTSVEFFPRGLLDVSAFADGEPVEAPTERPPADAEANGDQVKIPPAMARVLGRKSVS